MNNKKFVTPKNACDILGVHFKTLYNWEAKGKKESIRTPGGKRLYNVKKYIAENRNKKYREQPKLKICYCRVSSYSQKDDLERQILFMKNKYPNYRIIKDIGSGLNFKRKGLKKIMDYAINGEIEELIIAHKDRLCRFGFEMMEHLITEYSDGKIIILNETNLSPTEEMTKDLVSIINVFSARINGLRKYKKEIKSLK